MNIKHPAVLTSALAILILSIGLSFVSVQPVLANKYMHKALIDPELESALKKHFEKRWFNLISANDKQQKSLGRIIDEQVDQARPIRQKVREELINLTDLMASDSTSDQEIRDKIEHIKHLKNQLQEMRMNTILKVRAELSSEQRLVMANRAKGFLSGNPRLGYLK